MRFESMPEKDRIAQIGKSRDTSWRIDIVYLAVFRRLLLFENLIAENGQNDP